MKKKIIILLSLAIISIFCIIGCSETAKTNYSFDNFNDESVTLEVGDTYVPETLEVKDTAGKTHQLLVSASFNGESVWVNEEDGSFKVANLGTYLVKFTVADQESTSRTVTVNTKDETKPLVKLLSVRSEILQGSYDPPNVYVYDNSGEDITPTVSCYKIDGDTQTLVTATNGKYVLTELGNYKYVAEASDSTGNSYKTEKSFSVITMPSNVWENFDNANRMENVVLDENETCFSEKEWVESVTDEKGVTQYGVAKVSPNYYPATPWSQGNYLAIRFNKTFDQIRVDEWGYFTIRIMVTGNKSKKITTTDGTLNYEIIDEKFTGNVTLQNESLNLGTIKANEWQEVRVSRRDFFQDKKALAFKTFNTNKTLSDRYDQFATCYTMEVPTYLLRINSGANGIGNVTYYVDEITWEPFTEDVNAPIISFAGGDAKVEVGEKVELPTVTVTDDWDVTPTITKKVYYNDGTKDVEVSVSNDTFIAEFETNYEYRITARDNKGNESTKSYTVIVVPAGSIDPYVIANNDTEGGDMYVLTGTNDKTTSTWLSSFENRNGVAKVVTDSANNNGFGNIKLTVPKKIANNMIDGDFTVITIKVYIEVADVLDGVLTHLNLSPNPTHTACGNHWEIPVGEWTEITIRVGEFTSATNGTDTFILDNLTKGSRPQLYSNQIKWNADGTAVIINGKNNNTLTGQDAIDACKLTYYIDEIKWSKESDVTGPTISYTGASNVTVNSEYTISADVTDDFDTAPQITLVEMYKGSFATLNDITGTPLTLISNKITLTELGEYTVVIYAEDASGNESVKLIAVSCVSPVDANTVSELNTSSATGYFTVIEESTLADGHTSTSSVTYLESHAEANGVIKVVADNAQGKAAAVGRVKLNLSNEEIEKITSSDCDYVSFRMMIDSAIPYADVKFSFALSKAGIDYVNLNVAKGEWFELKIAKSSLKYNGATTNVTFNVNNIQYKSATQLILKSADGISSTKMNYYTTSGESKGTNTYGVSTEDLAKYSVITYYIDSIKLGKDSEDNTAPTLIKSGNSTSAFATGATSRSYAAPTFIDDVCYPTVTYRVYSCTDWEDATTYVKGEEITVYGQAACTSVVTSGATMYFSANDFTTSSREIIIEYSVSDKAGNILNVAQKVTVTNPNVS